MMFHQDDLVREKRTGREGIVDRVGKEENQKVFWVIFSDKKAPARQRFQAEQLELIDSPHSTVHLNP